jgi:DNA polymerase-1
LLGRELAAKGLLAVYENVDMPLVPVLADMERNGVWVDSAVLGGLSASLGAEAEALTRAIYELAGEEFNINSPKQLGVILFEKLKIHDELGIKYIKKTQNGYSTDVSVLEKLSKHPLARALLEYRSVAKLKGTYVDALPLLVNEVTGRVHTHFHQTGTATGRLSSSDPNVQNIPVRTARGRAIRAAFRPQEDGWVTVSADYSQIELRLLAHLSGDEALQQAFRDGADIHRATAARVFGVDPADVTNDQRSQAKAINFGIIYGMGPQRLAGETGVSIDEAKAFIEKYFAGYPRIREYIDQCIASAKAKRYAETITGRRRPIPEIHSTNRGDAVGAENIAVNSPVQGSASDLIKLAMVAIHKKLRESPLQARLLLQVHDELVLECAVGDLDAVKRIVKDCMEGAMDLAVPLTVEVGSGANWLEAH